MIAWRVASAFLSVFNLEHDAFVSGNALGKISPERVDIVDAAPKPRNRPGIVVDADQQGVDYSRHKTILSGPTSRADAHSWSRSTVTMIALVATIALLGHGSALDPLDVRGLSDLRDQPGGRRVEFVVVGHVEVIPGADSQPGLAVLAKDANEAPLALFEAEMLGQNILEVGEVAPEVQRGKHANCVAALDDCTLHLRDDRCSQVEIQVIDEHLQSGGFQSRHERFSYPGLVGITLAITDENVVAEVIRDRRDRRRFRSLTAAVERDRVVFLELGLEDRMLVVLILLNLLLHVVVQVHDADDAAVAPRTAAKAREQVSCEDAVS